MSRIIYNDGEACVFSDFNDQKNLEQKILFDSILWNLAANNEYPGYADGSLDNAWDPGTSYGSLIRPVRQSGMMSRASSSSVYVEGGLFLQLSASPLDADVPISMLSSSGGATLTGISPASSGQFRRDLIQCRIVSINNSTLAVNVSSGVTRAITNSLAVKRKDLTVEFSLKTGTEGTASFAANASNLPANDVGWEVIGAILVDDTGVSSLARHIWDYRMPWGHWQTWTEQKSFTMLNFSSSTWRRKADSNGLHRSSQSASDRMLARCPTAYSMHHNSNPGSQSAYTTMRISKVYVLADWASAVSTGAIIFSRARMMFDVPWPPTGIEHVPGDLADAAAGEIGSTRIGSTAVQHLVYSPSAYPEDPPLWSNGYPNPLTDSSADLPPLLGIDFLSDNVGDKVYGVEWSGWGGV